MIEIESGRFRQNNNLKQMSFNRDEVPIFEIDFSPNIDYISKHVFNRRDQVFDSNSSHFRRIYGFAKIIYKEKGSVYWNLIGSKYGQDLHLVAEELFHGYSSEKSLKMR